MSYLLSLHKRTGEPIGGEMSIPAGYKKHFDFTMLDRRRAGSSVAMLMHVIDELGTKKSPNKYKSTRGNVGALLAEMLKRARHNPDGVWHVIGK